MTDVTFDDSYPTGGEDVSPADLGLHRVNFAIATIKSGAGAVNVASAHYDPTSAKLVVRDETLAEIDDEADLTDLVIQVAAFGR